MAEAFFTSQANTVDESLLDVCCLNEAASNVVQPGSSADQEMDTQTCGGPDEEPLLIHGLSVERYREIYNSVLQPDVLDDLRSCEIEDYISEVLELKRLLWRKLNQPRLQETVMEDGRVEVIEILDLTGSQA